MCSLFQVFSLSQCKVLTLPPPPLQTLVLKNGVFVCNRSTPHFEKLSNLAEINSNYSVKEHFT